MKLLNPRACKRRAHCLYERDGIKWNETKGKTDKRVHAGKNREDPAARGVAEEGSGGEPAVERFKRCSTGRAWATRDHHDKSSGQTSIQFISL